MDYKKIIKNKEIRIKILKILSFIPDKTMIKWQYKIKTGRKLNLKNPQRFTEKLQYYKLYYHKPELTKCADKYEVRNYVKEKGLGNILNEIYGVWDNCDDIDFSKLPKQQIVFKTTNGSGTNIFCKNKDDIKEDKIKSEMHKWLNSKREKAGREWAYYDIKPKIICEKLINTNKNGDLPDYKFFCFNGKAYYLYYINNRYKQEKPNLGIFDLNFNQLPFYRNDEEKLIESIEKPDNFEEMIKIAEKLSKGFPHVRVDLYNVDGKIIFGEMTFYDGSGYQTYSPDEFDFLLGKKFDINF